jgi:hypothetical protein
MRRTDTKNIKADRERILSASNLTNGEARCLVANYYQAQDLRKRADMQLRHRGDKDDPVSMLDYFGDAQASIEDDLKKALRKFAEASPVGLWMMTQDGVAEVIAAGLLAYIDIERATTAGAIWAFAGLDPTAKWISREAADKMVCKAVRGAQPTDRDVRILCEQTGKKFSVVLRFATTDHAGNPVPLTRASLAKALSRRPYSPDLKQICWHAGQCFKRISGEPRALYGRLYREHKALVVARNEHGDYAERAKVFATRSADVRKVLNEGRLPAGNLDQQACNYATKIFLSHVQAIMHWNKNHQAPPRPFATAILGHAHEIRIPDINMFPGFAEAYYGYEALAAE